MNICEYERLAADEKTLRAATTAVLYAGSRRAAAVGSGMVEGPPPGGWPDWKREKAERQVLAAWRALVDDYSTPGCGCDYCAWEPGGMPRRIMCVQRWERLSPEARVQIGESISD